MLPFSCSQDKKILNFLPSGNSNIYPPNPKVIFFFKKYILSVFSLIYQQDNKATLPNIHCISKILYWGGEGITNTGLNLISTIRYFKHCMPYIPLSASSQASAVAMLQHYSTGSYALLQIRRHI